MKIVYDFPPNYDEIANHFKVKSNTVYTYGESLYSPLVQEIPTHLMVHEQTHVVQQTEGPFKPDEWWKEYIRSKEFRLLQEVEAYHNQYKFYCSEVRDRNMQAKFLYAVALDLASPMYGSIILMTEASKAIKSGII